MEPETRMGSAVLEVLWRFRIYRLPTPIPTGPALMHFEV